MNEAAAIDMRITREPGIPLHQQVSRALRELATSALDPGDAIPTETELETRFGVSRATVRRAVDDLVEEGLLARRQGAGTFVCSPPLVYEPARLASWSESIRLLGQVPRTRAIQRQLVPGPSWVRALLQVDEHESLVWIWRLRASGDQPMSLMVNYLAAALAPGLDTIELHQESLYDVLREQYGLVPARAEDEVEAKLVNDDEAALLDVSPGSPLIEVRRVAFLADERPLEVSIVRSRADRYRYRATFASQSAPPGRAR